MKLLLVEDEQLIRQGILMKTSWQQFGIDEVMHAEDGSDAVQIAEQFRPDILLTDIRMPRMDGIEAARNIRTFCPKVRIIFMSGFSDKAYLKAAISLQAVHYVEKPIQLNELHEAIRSASSMIAKERQTDMGEEESLPLIRREIAALLCSPEYHAERLSRLLPLIGSQPGNSPSCASCMLKWHHPIELPENLLQKLEAAAQTAGLHSFSMVRDDFHAVIHLISGPEQDALFPDILERWIHDIGHSLPKAPGFHLAVGRQVQGMDRMYDSYLSAVIQLQRSFYEPPNTVIRESAAPSSTDSFLLPDERLAAFAHSLHQEGPQQAKLWLTELTRDIRRYPDTQVAYTKGIYLQLYQTIQQAGKESGNPAFKQEAAVGAFAARLYACQTLDGLHKLLSDELGVLFDYLETRKGNSIIRHVMQYIERHYGNRQLSLTEISESVGVTVPHMCFVFKEGTGMTIKHHLSEYRIDRAKELLANKDLKLFDIALQVGYGDGEYFSKIFKKITGLQPSEYRKRVADV
ncbi:two-component system, response regulator YesN [Paenibacillus sp. UNCCL117]|uniref:response regulator n=1 Tax=unclassified Paenibacillus TaxID=185978 RepID=UPI0008865658|nr:MULTISPECIES: response regulator [unclassified Paenibacillus]SDD05298.1 two-component system, response regulator YesN [Paenibacillus sp. cl123]SFW31914.1 two-component system, response regulator YesN [Paenibacillus sp. UNCCL117]